MSQETTSQVSRREYLGTIAAGATLLGGCVGSFGGSSGGYTLGYSNFTNSVPFEVMVRKATEWYGEDLDGVEVKTTAADGSTSQQIQDCRNLLRQNIDGLIITPTDSNGLAKIAEEADVPVFSADIPINSKDLGLHIGVNQKEFGYQAGKQLVKVMNESVDAEEKKVLEIMMDQDNSNAVLRHQSFNRAIDEADNVEIVKQIEIDGYSATEVAENATTWLQNSPEVHGAFAPWGGGPVGFLKALERTGMKEKVGTDGHIHIVSLDANATILDHLQKGYIDNVLDQPVTFYGPLSIHYMTQYLDADQDESALPNVGEEITDDDVTITGSKHFDIEVWKEPRWSPSSVREFVTFDDENLGFPFLTTNTPVIGEDDADKPYIWGNLTQHV